MRHLYITSSWFQIAKIDFVNDVLQQDIGPGRKTDGLFDVANNVAYCYAGLSTAYSGMPAVISLCASAASSASLDPYASRYQLESE